MKYKIIYENGITETFDLSKEDETVYNKILEVREHMLNLCLHKGQKGDIDDLIKSLISEYAAVIGDNFDQKYPERVHDCDIDGMIFE